MRNNYNSKHGGCEVSRPISLLVITVPSHSSSPGTGIDQPVV
jgi:hypothetical protein